MEPLLPGDGEAKLPALALALLRGAERLHAPLTPSPAPGSPIWCARMNSYYSNLIEGHRTTQGH